jgi:octopine/nopaline transport system ATP-binding protein
MRFSPLVERIDGPGVAAWAIHEAAIAAQERGEDVIMLSIGDPDFATPEPVTRAAIDALETGDTHYTDVLGRRSLRTALARMLAGPMAQPALSADNIVAVGGGQNALFAASLCLLGEGDEAIVLTPMYLTYEATFAAAGARLVHVPMPAETGFRPDAAAIRAAVTPRTRAIIFANPNNPTGVVLRRGELEAIAAIAIEHDLAIIVDEVYAALTFEVPHVYMAALPGMADRTVSIGSLSKSHAMTGWRAGWIAGNAELIAHIGRLELAMLYGLPGFVQQAALAAVERYEAITGEMTERYRRRKEVVCAALAGTPGLRVLSPEAGMFVLLDVRATGLSGFDFAWQLFRETGVATLDASAFGPSAEGFLRVAFTSSEDTLAEACRRIDRFVRGLMQSSSV